MSSSWSFDGADFGCAVRALYAVTLLLCSWFLVCRVLGSSTSCLLHRYKTPQHVVSFFKELADEGKWKAYGKSLSAHRSAHVRTPSPPHLLADWPNLRHPWVPSLRLPSCAACAAAASYTRECARPLSLPADVATSTEADHQLHTSCTEARREQKQTRLELLEAIKQ